MPDGIFGVIMSSISFASVVERLHAERQAHPLDRSEQVGRHRACRSRSAARTAARAAARQLADAIGDGRDLEIGADRSRIRDSRPRLSRSAMKSLMSEYIFLAALQLHDREHAVVTRAHEANLFS